MKKISRTIQRRLAVLLSVMVAICSTPTVAYAQLAEDQPIAEVQVEESDILLGEPDGSSTAHTLTLVGVADITSDSIGDLESLGFTIDGNTATLSFTDDDESFELPTIMKDNCEFYGWYITGESPSTAEIYVQFSTSIGEDVSYTAKFVGSHTVTFKDGETTFPTLEFSYLTGQATIVLPEVPDKTGYTKNGWILEGDESETVHGAGVLNLADIGIGTTIQEGNLVFNASYTPIDYTITLTGLEGISANSISAIKNLGFTVSGNNATISKTIEDSLTIPAISKADARFIKWADDNSETQDGKTVVLEAGDITSNLTYEAIFANEYTLTLSGLTGITADSVAAIEDAGFTISGNKATLKFVNGDEEFIIPNIAKEGYTFFGYYTGTNPEDATKDVVFVPSTAGDTTYTAYFQKIYTITFKDGETTLPTLSDNYLSDATSINLPTLPDKAYYTKNGWVLEGDESETVHGAGVLNLADIGIGTTIQEGNLVFNASYTPIDYTITLTGLEGISANSISAIKNLGFTVSGNNATISKTIEDSLTIPAISRPHHDFSGWQKGTNEPTQTVILAVGEITSNITLIAKWRAASAGEITSVSLNMIELRLYQKQAFTLKATVNPEDVPDKSVIWTSSDADIATVSAGRVEAVDVGTCTITATSVIDATKFATCEVTVLKSEVVDTDDEGRIIDPGSKAIDEETGQANVWVGGLNLNGYYFTGKAIKPTIHVYKGYQLLREGVDYTLSYKNNTKVTTSTAENKQPKITIKMKARHSGSKAVYFKILPMPLDQLAAQDPTLCVPPKSKKANLTPVLTYQDTAVKYSSKDVSFKWFATDAAGNALDISSDCNSPGLYAVKIFAGQSGNLVADTNGYQVATVLVSDKVLFNKVKIGNFKSSLPYNNGTAVVQAAKLSYKSSVLVEDTDYTVTYKNNYDIGTATVTYEAIKDAAGNYTGDFAGKVVKTFKIKGKYALDTSISGNAEITLAKDSYPFNNANIKPAVTVTATVINNAGETETRTLVQDKDYTVSYKNNKTVASQDAKNSKGKDIAPQVIIKGKGDYKFGAKNSAVVRFNITKADLSSLVLTVYDKAYSKKTDAYKSTKIVFSDYTYRDLKLKAGKDYTATYTTSDGTAAPAVGQTVDITITANETSPYTGTVTSTYRILDSKADVNKAKVVVNPNSKGKTSACIYTGTDIEPGQADQPALVVTMGSGKSLKELVQGTDYEIVGYYNNVAPSKKAIVVVRGIGSYYGVKVVKFTISTKPVSTCWGGIYGQLD